MPLIKIISTGGTIANTSQGLISIDEVLKDIPQARAMADFEIAEATRVRSGALRLSHWHDIARMTSAAAQDSRVDGIIVTHGTFTTARTCAAKAFWSRCTRKFIRRAKSLRRISVQADFIL